MKCPFSSLLIDFSLKSILLDIRIATLSCFLGPFDWKIFFHPFTLRYVYVSVKVCFLIQPKDRSFFHISSVSLCLFVG